MENEERLRKLLTEQIELEKTVAAKLKDLEERVDSVAAQLLVREMQLDSEKHAKILGAALRAMSGPKGFWDYSIHIDADKTAVRRELKAHIAQEEKMMKSIREEMSKTDDDALKLLLEHFEDDEERHHANIKAILSRMSKMDL